jgi:hypothetical protein
MLRIPVVIILMLIAFMQTYAQQALVAVGGSGSNSTGSISFSVGQVSYVYATDSIYGIQQGVQQPNDSLGIVSVVRFKLFENIHIFPNPVSNKAEVVINNWPNSVEYQLHSSCGFLIRKSILTEFDSFIPFDELSKGTYILTLFTSKSSYSVYKIIK